MNERERDAEEARRTLADLSRGSAALDGARLREAEPPQDAVELWARRIGRALGFLFLILLVVNLFTGWFF